MTVILQSPVSYDEGGNAYIQAFRCSDCGRLSCQVRASCENCGCDALAPEKLPQNGILWTWTSQEYPPPAPPYFRVEDRNSFTPYFIGYVQLGEVLVLARISSSLGTRPRIGDRLSLSLQFLPGAEPSMPPIPVFVSAP